MKSDLGRSHSLVASILIGSPCMTLYPVLITEFNADFAPIHKGQVYAGTALFAVGIWSAVTRFFDGENDTTGTS